jgi:hypothetical protein
MSYFSSPVKERSLYCGDFPLEFDFSAKTLDIPVNHGDCQFSAATSISDRAIACVKLPVYFDVIPVLGVPHISCVFQRKLPPKPVKFATPSERSDAGSLFLLYLVSCRQICLFFRSDSLVKLGVI